MNSSGSIMFEIMVQQLFNEKNAPANNLTLRRLRKGEEESNADFDESFEFFFPKKKVDECHTPIGNILVRFIFPMIDFQELFEKFMGNERGDVSNPKAIKSPDQDFKVPVWIRDPFLVMESSNGEPILLDPFHPWPSDRHTTSLIVNRYISEMVSAQLQIPSKSTPFFLHGGNILAGDNFAVMGDQIFKTNNQEYNEKISTKSRERFQPTLATILGLSKKAIIVVRCPGIDFRGQPLEQKWDALRADWDMVEKKLFHLDMYLTLVGKSSDGITEEILLGKVHEWDFSKEDWVEVGENDPMQRFLDWHELEYKRKFGSRKIPIKIIRIPLLRWQGMILSYNNCLVECPNGSRRRLYLPQFAWPNLDKMIPNSPDFERMDKEVIKQLKIDFDVKMIDMGFRLMAAHHSGLDCMVSVLERD